MEFLNVLFHGLSEDESILVASSKDKQDWQFVLTHSIDEAENLAAAQDRAERDVFFGVTPRQHDNKDVVTRATCLWSDFDAKDYGEGGKVAVLEDIQGMGIPTTFLVDSGHGYHAYWMLNDAVPPDQARKAMEHIRKFHGGDPVYNETRLMRFPNTMNRKGEPVLCHVVSASPTIAYDIPDIMALAEIDPKVAHRLATGDGRGFRSRSERDWNAVVELLKRGVSEECIRMLFIEMPIGDRYRERGQDTYLNRTVQRAKSRLNQSDPTEMFAEIEDCWYVANKSGRRQVSTFVFEPKKLLQGPEEDTLIGTMQASGHKWDSIALPKSAFAGTSSLLKELPIAYWQWLGSDKEVRMLLPFLLDQLNGSDVGKAVHYVGRVGDYWVCPGCTFDSDRIYSFMDAPVSYVNVGREHPQVEYEFLEHAKYVKLSQQIFELLPQTNDPSTIWPILGWYAAAPIKSLLHDADVHFPILALYGSHGGGKTSTLSRLMQPMFGYIKPVSYNCTTTQFVILSLLASTNGVPVSFSEFRRSSMSSSDYARITRFLLLSYDVGHDTRGRADQTTQDYPLRAPITVDGEDAISDPATKERSLMVNLDPGNIAVGSNAWSSFNTLIELPLRGFAGNYIRFTLREQFDLRAMLQEELHRVDTALDRTLPDRVRRNFALPLLGLTLLEKHLSDYGVTLPERTPEFVRDMLDPVAEITILSTTGRTITAADEFVEDIINEVSLAKGPYFKYRYLQEENELWFHLSTAIRWWYQKRRREGQPSLEASAIKVQLAERDVNERPGEGQYIVGRRTINVGGTAMWCYGISLDEAHRVLDIPDRLRTKTVNIELT